MTFPKKFIVSVKTHKKIFTCPACKRPFSANARWKRKIKTGSRYLVCKNPGCSENLSDHQAINRNDEAESQVSSVDTAEKKKKTCSKEGKMSINALLNSDDGSSSAGAKSGDAGAPSGVATSIGGPSNIVTSGGAAFGNFFPGSSSDQVPVQRDLSATPQQQIANMSNVNLSTNGSASVALAPSGVRIVPPRLNNTVTVNGVAIETPVAVPVGTRMVEDPKHPFFIDLDAIADDLAPRRVPMGNSDQPSRTVARIAANNQGGNDGVENCDTETVDLMCSEDELEIDSQVLPTIEDLRSLVEDIISMDSLLFPLEQREEEVLDSIANLVPTSEVHDPMEGNTDETDEDADGPDAASNACPRDLWDYGF